MPKPLKRTITAVLAVATLCATLAAASPPAAAYGWGWGARGWGWGARGYGWRGRGYGWGNPYTYGSAVPPSYVWAPSYGYVYPYYGYGFSCYGPFGYPYACGYFYPY